MPYKEGILPISVPRSVKEKLQKHKQEKQSWANLLLSMEEVYANDEIDVE